MDLMNPIPLPETETGLHELQIAMASVVRGEPLQKTVRYVAGVDAAYGDTSSVAAAVIYDFVNEAIVETQVVQDKTAAAYIPGGFALREVPPTLCALERLVHPVDLIICDGQGVAHPRGFGLACHVGVSFDVPTIGCGKTRLFGEMIGELGAARGSHRPLMAGQRTIGAEVRTQNNVKPVYVSVGHKITLKEAIDWTVRLALRFRLTEPIRAADHACRAALKTIEQDEETHSP